MSMFHSVKSFFNRRSSEGYDAVSHAMHDPETRAGLSKKTIALATGFGFGMTLEAGLATIFGIASSGVLAVIVGGAVMYAYMNMPDEHHHHILKLGKSSIDALSKAIKDPNNVPKSGLALAMDESAENQKSALHGAGDIAVQVISNDVYDGDVIHITDKELTALVNHRLAQDSMQAAAPKKWALGA